MGIDVAAALVVGLHQEEIIGKIITYKSMDKGVKDLPRFPRFIDFRSERDM